MTVVEHKGWGLAGGMWILWALLVVIVALFVLFQLVLGSFTSGDDPDVAEADLTAWPEPTPDLNVELWRAIIPEQFHAQEIAVGRDFRAEDVRQRLLQEPIAGCMAAAGFDYEEQLPPDRLVDDAELTDLFARASSLDPLSADYRQQFGYGVSTLDAYLIVNRAYRYGDIDSFWGQSQRTSPDVGPSEAFHGAGPRLDGGCLGEAEARFPAPIVPADAETRALFGQISDARTAVLATPEYVEAMQEWKECGHASGYSFERRADVRLSINQRLWTISDRRITDGSPFRVEDLAEVQADERAMAVALRDCDREFEARVADFWRTFIE